jgi:hypothetical protein
MSKHSRNLSVREVVLSLSHLGGSHNSAEPPRLETNRVLLCKIGKTWRRRTATALIPLHTQTKCNVKLST